jgi:integrase
MARKRRGRGEGGIYQRGDGQWVGSVSLGYDASGKRRRKVVYGATKDEVQKKLRKVQVKSDAGTLAEAGSLTVGDFLQNWLETTAKNKVRPTTYNRYEQLVRIHLIPAIGWVSMSKLGTVHVEQCYAEMESRNATAWTRKMAATVLNCALRHAVRRKLIAFNPAVDVVKARPDDKEMEYLTEPQGRQFLHAASGNRLHALFAVAIGSGMRQGELLGLHWPDVDFEKGTVSVRRSLAQVGGHFILKEPKSKSSRRTISLPRFAVDALHEHRKAMLAEGQDVRMGAVFVTRTGQFIGKSNLIRQVFKPILTKANKRAGEDADKLGAASLPEIRFHDLRHTHATNLLAQGHSIKAVSQRLGHASIELTLRVYAHVLPTDDGKLAESLNRMFG